MLLEICANSVQSAINAQLGGADRVELCTNLEGGGTTPNAAAIQLTKHTLSKSYNKNTTEVYVLIRPRVGDFCYSPIEIALMKRNIIYCRACNIDGVVLGALKEDGTVDVVTNRIMKELAWPMKTTFHRAIDQTPNPLEALEQIIEIGFNTVLTSGTAPTAWEGRAIIEQLVKQAAGRIQIMPGAGVSADNINELKNYTKAAAFHLSAKKKVLPDSFVGNKLFEPSYYETDIGEVRRAKKRLLA